MKTEASPKEESESSVEDAERWAWRQFYDTLPEPLRSVMLRELDYDPEKDPLRKDVIRIPIAR